MPIYVYKHPEHEEYVEVFQGMNDKHEYTDELQLLNGSVFSCSKMSCD